MCISSWMLLKLLPTVSGLKQDRTWPSRSGVQNVRIRVTELRSRLVPSGGLSSQSDPLLCPAWQGCLHPFTCILFMSLLHWLHHISCYWLYPPVSSPKDTHTHTHVIQYFRCPKNPLKTTYPSVFSLLSMPGNNSCSHCLHSFTSFRMSVRII